MRLPPGFPAPPRAGNRHNDVIATSATKTPLLEAERRFVHEAKYTSSLRSSGMHFTMPTRNPH
jgi:hypothetical protein